MCTQKARQHRMARVVELHRKSRLTKGGTEKTSNLDHGRPVWSGTTHPVWSEGRGRGPLCSEHDDSGAAGSFSIADRLDIRVHRKPRLVSKVTQATGAGSITEPRVLRFSLCRSALRHRMYTLSSDRLHRTFTALNINDAAPLSRQNAAHSRLTAFEWCVHLVRVFRCLRAQPPRIATPTAAVSTKTPRVVLAGAPSHACARRNTVNMDPVAAAGRQRLRSPRPAPANLQSSTAPSPAAKLWMRHHHGEDFSALRLAGAMPGLGALTQL
jgi:hypothetical protein